MSDLSPDMLYIWLHFGEVPFKIITFSIFYHLGPPYSTTKPAEHVIFLLYPADPQIHWPIYPVNNNVCSLKFMSCPAVSCSKCVSGDVNWLRPCANSHLMLTKRNSFSPIGLFSSSVCFLFWNIRGMLPTLHTGYRHSNCVTGFFFLHSFNCSSKLQPWHKNTNRHTQPVLLVTALFFPDMRRNNASSPTHQMYGYSNIHYKKIQHFTKVLHQFISQVMCIGKKKCRCVNYFGR